MVEVPYIIAGSPESVGFVTDNFCLVIETFNGAVMNGHMEPSEYVFLVASHHPGEIPHGLKT